MRIISLNAWGGRLHEVLIDYVRQADADVLCLQEVLRAPGADGGWSIYRDAGLELPQRANLFAEISAALPGYDGFFCPTSRGELFNGDSAIAAEFGLATFVRKSHSVIAQGLDFVHGGFSADGWGEHPRPRNAHCIRVFSHEQASAVTIAHMHGLRDPAGKDDTAARQEQAAALVRLVERIWPGNEGLVVCGDFNVLPDSATFAILARLGLSELVTGNGLVDTRTSYYLKPGRFADYMLVTPGVSVAKFEVVETPEVSDHRALLLDIG
ncbi:endonuclease/exonuclease/phosphatase family protein [Rhizobium hidalgonense]|uniref:Endonuclease/exonuclease/phosphatase family protein n=1 Tax=Rhizobium hidalgonense TaxID=1538159 RepID=A0A2A6KDD6_9HYPH|nr:endonuclease/exonuclease/phosphatase family protein [Rhizobium hidalgonense]EJC72862.1 metal-dependent hydrolase [Rhizobium leguminosarum bv. trifolii WSM2012]MDR9774502.1 endonuclease/exonuclease/phosphatase family protein [Rhizobium hidalgonense]MDR9805244.1 endonuclease/exonuclease/phosphatase family protein [Rhizobium hidalgonense]MDR9809511.1 endonuclease/exonuclease/phosphatase family protein [Rhizobium hidalgonense]PDT22415.1 metal-dependent hydrolase [Rhizobium hidalgonense]